jgi:hypothetical protein
MWRRAAHEPPKLLLGGKHLAQDFTLQRVVAYDFLDTLVASSYRVEHIYVQAKSEHPISFLRRVNAWELLT